jgi:thymidine phosphorylase
MLRLAGHADSDLRKRLRDGSALRKLAQLIEAQDGDPRVTEDPAVLPTAPVQRPVEAASSGVVSGADALEIALAGKALGAGRDRKDAPIDLAVGIVLQKKIGDPVQAGEPLAVIHGRTENDVASVSARVAAAFTIAPDAKPRPLLLRRVTRLGIEPLDT